MEVRIANWETWGEQEAVGHGSVLVTGDGGNPTTYDDATLTLKQPVSGDGTQQFSVFSISAPNYPAEERPVNPGEDTGTTTPPEGPSVAMRAGNHGAEDRVVLEFSGIDNIEVMSHSLDETPPVRGGSAELRGHRRGQQDRHQHGAGTTGPISTVQEPDAA